EAPLCEGPEALSSPLDRSKKPNWFAAQTTTSTSQPTKVGRRKSSDAHLGRTSSSPALAMKRSTTSLRFCAPSPGLSTILTSATMIAIACETMLKTFIYYHSPFGLSIESNSPLFGTED